jgi:hypothetical protein
LVSGGGDAYGANTPIKKDFLKNVDPFDEEFQYMIQSTIMKWAAAYSSGV